MSFNKNLKQQGFTIVELLIVVVVIAILAAITIVSYNNITNRANASAAKSTAATWQKKVELYYAENSAYPTTLAQINGDSTKSWHMPTTSAVTYANLSSDNGKTSVVVKTCGSGAGFSILYWNYDGTNTGKPAETAPQITLGTPTSCVAVPAS